MITGYKNCRSTKGALILILNLSEAKIPGVVRVDLAALPFTHFHVRSGTEGSVLGYNDAEGRFTALALFADRAAADKTLHKIEAELMHSSPGGGWILRITVILVGVILLLSILNWVVGMAMAPQHMSASEATTEMSAGGPAPVSGMPIDADSKFGGQP